MFSFLETRFFTHLHYTFKAKPSRTSLAQSQISGLSESKPLSQRLWSDATLQPKPLTTTPPYCVTTIIHCWYFTAILSYYLTTIRPRYSTLRSKHLTTLPPYYHVVLRPHILTTILPLWHTTLFTWCLTTIPFCYLTVMLPFYLISPPACRLTIMWPSCKIRTSSCDDHSHLSSLSALSLFVLFLAGIV